GIWSAASPTRVCSFTSSRDPNNDSMASVEGAPGLRPIEPDDQEKKMDDMMIGISAEPGADRSLLREAGIRWMRYEFPFPFEDRMNGKVSQKYVKARATAASLVSGGLGLLGIPPLFGYGNWEPGP